MLLHDVRRRLPSGHKAKRMVALEAAVRRQRNAYLDTLIARAVRSFTSHLMGILRRLWRSQDTAEQYLAAATDLADLERRVRVLERERGGPLFVTFNH